MKNKTKPAEFKIERINAIISVAELNDGYSNIACDDNCWLLMHGGKPAYHIFEEAKKILDQLPSSPYNYQPLIDLQELSHDEFNQIPISPNCRTLKGEEF